MSPQNPEKQHSTALVEFFMYDNMLYTFVIRGDLPEWQIADQAPIQLKCPLNEQLVVDTVQFIRNYISDADQKPEKNDPSVYEPLFEPFFQLTNQIFHAELLALIKPYDALYLVPYGVLHYLPLHAARLDDQCYLIDRFKIAYLPSASVLPYIQQTKPYYHSRPSILLAGTDYTNRSPMFKWEVEEISKLDLLETWNVTLLNSKLSTKENILELSEQHSIVHISTHGFFDKEEPMHSGLLLTNTKFDREKNDFEDRTTILSATTIFESLRLKADLVAFSACVTGQSLNKPGDELIGLTRSLIYAGAKTMIVSLFPTFKNITGHRDPNSQETMFAHFYRLWLKQKLSKVEAFQQFVQEIKKRHPAPHKWFSYILVGNMY